MKKPFIFSFANSKGGVAKTTTCLGVGCELAKLGKKTLLIDLDHQANLSDDVGRGDENYTITDLFEDPKFDLNRVIYPALDDGNKIDNLFIVPADITLAMEVRAAERYRHRLNILGDAIKKLDDSFDYILIDCRPAIDLGIENALLITDCLVIPVDPDKRATKGISDLLEVAQEVRRTDNIVFTLVKTKVDTRNKNMLVLLNAHITDKKYPVTTTEIRISEKYKQATAHGRPATLDASGDRPSVDHAELTAELLTLSGGV